MPEMTQQSDMKQLYSLSEQEIHLLIDDRLFAKADALQRQGELDELEVDGATIYGTVLDDDGFPVAIEVGIEEDEIYAECTCDRRGKPCEHVGALLLAWVRTPERFKGHDEDRSRRTARELRLTPDPAGEFREILQEQTLQDLRDMARRWGIEVHGTRKDPIVEQIAVALSDPASIRARIDTLDAAAIELLAYIHLTLDVGYGFNSETMAAKLLTRDAQTQRHVLHRQIEALTEIGLLLKFQSEALTYYLLPLAVRNVLPSQPGFIPLYPEPRVSQLEVREQPAMSAIHTLYQVWHYVAQHEPRRESVRARLPAEDEWPSFVDWDNVPEEVDQIVQQRRSPYYLYNVSATVPTPRYRFRAIDRDALSAATGCTNEELEFYYILLESMGAISAAPGDPIAHQSRVFERLLSLPPSTQMRAILFAWYYIITWSEMDIVRRATDALSVRRNLTYTSFSQQDLYREWRGARQAILRFLSTIDEGTWVSIDGLLRAIYQVHPSLLHAHSDANVWWLRAERTKKQFGTTYEDWLDSGGRFVLATLHGPLFWLGAISLGYVGTEAVALRVTPVGSFALHRRSSVVEQAPQAIPHGAVRLDDNLTAQLVPNQVPAQLHDLFHIIGRLEETTPTQFRYRVTAEGVLRALEQGQTVDTMIQAIARWSGHAPPPAWRDQLTRWSENYGKLHVYDDITLLELGDDVALQELLSNTSLRAHVIHTFSPRLVAIHPTAVDDLVQEMEKRGYTPHVE
ncbi:MAG: helicase-associated domain-containing protein [Anaerolineae bacterium]|nr:helicase-associated domain-containing protein [Anaerolineae bacterium]